MPTTLKSYAQKTSSHPGELREVTRIADLLLSHLNTPIVRKAIEDANVPGGSSRLIQEAFAAYATELGFRAEMKGLFGNYSTRGLRPDYYLPIGETGILLEVERGKTTMNNMDLLDFWKCHLCEHAHYLFLMVPQELQQNSTRVIRKEFDMVNRRLEAFFRPENATNVRGLFLFGY